MENKISNKRDRSSAYPAISLEEATMHSSKLYQAFGKAPFKRESAAIEIGYKSLNGPSGSKIAALVHFGLLERNGDLYNNSPLAIKISHPKNDDDKKEAIFQAVKSPKLFNALIKEFSGATLPNALDNILIQNYGISRKVAKEVANNFKKSIKFAELYPNEVVLNTNNDNSDSIENILGEHTPNTYTISDRTINQKNTPINFNGMQSIHTPSGLIICYPNELAYHFAIGEFGKQIKDLDDAIDLVIKKINNKKDDTAPIQKLEDN